MYKYSIYNYEYEGEKGYIVTNFINNQTFIMSKETYEKYKNFEKYLKDEEVKKMMELGFIVKAQKVR